MADNSKPAASDNPGGGLVVMVMMLFPAVAYIVGLVAMLERGESIYP